jgi:ABC-2 type transport system ATP-binding protein
MIETNELTKRYGDKIAVDSMTFSAPTGVVTGFLGPNGAGKSTTMRMILGLDRPTSGSGHINGKEYASFRAPLHEVGAMLEARSIHPGRSARSHLLAMAQTHGLSRQRVDEVIAIVGLEEVASRRVGAFSLGMAQRLGIAAALLGDPPVLLFDEPVNGLDPEGIRWIRGFLRSLAAEGRAVLVSSHLMSELEDSADHLIVIGRGRLVADTSVRELLAAASQDRVALRTTARSEAMTVLTRAGATVAATGRDTLTVSGLAAGRIVALLGEGAVPFSEVSAHRATLEEAYMELTRDAVEFQAAALETAEGESR